MFKSHSIKSNHRVLKKNKVYTYGAQVLHLIIVPPIDIYGSTFLAAQMQNNSHENTIYIRSLSFTLPVS
jgi:hypothetical protein